MALRCDLIIRDATLFDGTGAPRRVGDIGVKGDRIAAMGDLGGASGDREVIATGKAVAPGFIDAHTHDDRAVLCGPTCTTCNHCSLTPPAHLHHQAPCTLKRRAPCTLQHLQSL